MSVWLLDPENPGDVSFPPPELGNRGDGLLAVGGDYSVPRLVEAYSNGIFPWTTWPGYGIGWHSPDPRFVLLPEALHIPKSLERTLRKHPFEITVDRAFERVIAACADAHRRDGVWITKALREGYIALHRAGHAHSVEAWRDGELAGGLYGVSVGPVFCGESMFALVADASKVAFATVARALFAAGCPMIDCQVHGDHLARFGAVDIPRDEYLARLRRAKAESPPIDWDHLLSGQTGATYRGGESIPLATCCQAQAQAR